MEGIENMLLPRAMPARGALGKNEKVDPLSEARQIQAAKDFESVLIGKLLETMKNTIGDWGLEKEAFSEQVDGIFWLYLARELANQGGFGIWEDLHRSLTGSDKAVGAAEAVGAVSQEQ